MSLISLVLLDEKELLDLICKEHKLYREKASMNINYVPDDHKNGGSWTVQVQAPGLPESINILELQNLTNNSKQKYNGK